jgi:hypothetical protein
MKIVKLAVVAMMVTAACVSLAQGGGRQGGGQGQGQGGRGGMMGGQMGAMGANPIMLVNRPDVQAELKITDAQRTQLQTLMREGMGGGRGPGGGGGGGGFDAQAMQERMQRMEAEIAKILTADQNKRLLEIRIQTAGASALLLPAVQKQLNLTQQQIDRIAELQRLHQQANMALMQQMRDGGLDRSELQTRMQNNQNTLNAELQKVLTAEQAAKLKAMAGAEFKANPNLGRGGGGAGPGRRGGGGTTGGGG